MSHSWLDSVRINLIKLPCLSCPADFWLRNQIKNKKKEGSLWGFDQSIDSHCCFEHFPNGLCLKQKGSWATMSALSQRWLDGVPPWSNPTDPFLLGKPVRLVHCLSSQESREKRKKNFLNPQRSETHEKETECVFRPKRCILHQMKQVPRSDLGNDAVGNEFPRREEGPKRFLEMTTIFQAIPQGREEPHLSAHTTSPHLFFRIGCLWGPAKFASSQREKAKVTILSFQPRIK